MGRKMVKMIDWTLATNDIHTNHAIALIYFYFSQGRTAINSFDLAARLQHLKILQSLNQDNHSFKTKRRRFLVRNFKRLISKQVFKVLVFQNRNFPTLHA